MFNWRGNSSRHHENMIAFNLSQCPLEQRVTSLSVGDTSNRKLESFLIKYFTL